jgi:uncharacterized protein (DUF433 family)
MTPRPTSRDWGQRLDGIATERDRESAVVMPCRSVSIVIRGTSLAGIGEPEEVGVQDERGGGLDRFTTPLYSVTEAARYLDVPASTFATWTHGYRRRPAGRREVVGGPVLTALPRSRVRVFNEVVAAYLQRVEFGPEGYHRLIHLPAYEVADIVVDPERGFGQPTFVRGGTRLEDALALFRAGEPLDVVAEEYGVPRDQLGDAVRIATRVAA